MALGKQNKDTPDGKLLILKIITKNKVDGKDVVLVPHQFQIREKVDGKWVVRPETTERVGGDLFKIEQDVGEYNNEEYDILKLYLSDSEAQETYLLDLRLTQDSRQLLNSLDNLENYKDLGISLYKTVSKKNGKSYSNISVWQGRDLVKGKVAFGDLPQPEPIKDKAGKIIKYDYTDVDNYFKKILPDLIKRVEAANKGAKKVSVPKAALAETKTEKAAPAENLDEDVPF